MNSTALQDILNLIQTDIANRGLCSDPAENLFTVCPDDFAAACHGIAEHPQPAIAVVTGFLITGAKPPAPETDGPLGAIFFARALLPLGIKVALVTDGFCSQALSVGLKACGLEKEVPLIVLPEKREDWQTFFAEKWLPFCGEPIPLSHLLAIERPGPSHTRQSVMAQCSIQDEAEKIQNTFAAEVPQEHQDRCHNMKGVDITEEHSPVHLLFEWAQTSSDRNEFGTAVTTIGIGDGGNEIGMGKIPWAVIRRNIHGAGWIACRVPADYLISCGVSNWGAYALAAGVYLLRKKVPDTNLFSVIKENELLKIMVDEGNLVDGVLSKPVASVDGIPPDKYLEPLAKMASFFVSPK